jgi:hypothetical protein
MPRVFLSAATLYCFQCAHGYIAGALEALDAVVDALLLPWLAAIAAPIEALLARMHGASYSSEAHGLASSSANSVDSTFLAALERYCDGLATHQLRLLGSAPVAEPLRRSLASRVLSLFVRHACMVRPLDDAGRQRLARDAAQVGGDSNLVRQLLRRLVTCSHHSRLLSRRSSPL